jgi:hypothetical protein
MRMPQHSSTRKHARAWFWGRAPLSAKKSLKVPIVGEGEIVPFERGDHELQNEYRQRSVKNWNFANGPVKDDPPD